MQEEKDAMYDGYDGHNLLIATSVLRNNKLIAYSIE